VRDLSLGGLFLETAALRAIGTHTKVDFLVGEGQIRADAVVRHIVAGCGLGLKFTAVTEQDRRKFASLLRRLRSSARGPIRELQGILRSGRKSLQRKGLLIHSILC